MKANDTRAKGMVFNQKAGEYIQELEAEQQELVYDCRDHRIAKEKALAQLAELREAIRWAIPLISGQPNITEKLAALLPEDVAGGKPVVESPRSDGER